MQTLARPIIGNATICNCSTKLYYLIEGHTEPDAVGWQAEHITVATVENGQALVGVEHGQTLRHVLERSREAYIRLPERHGIRSENLQRDRHRPDLVAASNAGGNLHVRPEFAGTVQVSWKTEA